MTCHICKNGIDANASSTSPMRKSRNRAKLGLMDAHAICNARAAAQGVA